MVGHSPDDDRYRRLQDDRGLAMTTPPAEAKVMQSDRDLDKLPIGIYRVYWQSGGSSLASVGMDYTGKRWIAPTNWTAKEVKGPAALISVHGWGAIERVEWIHIPDPAEGDEDDTRASTPSASAGDLVEGVKALSQFVRHKELCAVIGGYGFCSCGLEAAQDIVAAALTEARAGEKER
jgi:hypothetical protein